MMDPDFDWAEAIGVALAGARQRGTVVDIRLDDVTTLEQAEAVQLAAVEAYGGVPIGYSIQGTSTQSRRQLNSDEPIFGPLLDFDVVSSGESFRLPPGIVGAGCSFVFGLGRPFPAPGEETGRASCRERVCNDV